MDEKSLQDSNDDLDELLDSALSDFQSLKFSSSNQRTESELDETKDKESPSASIPSKIQGLGKGMGLPDMRSRNKGSNPKGKRKSNEESHVAEALEKLREQTRNTVRGLESTKSENLDPDAMMEDWVKQFEELAGSQGMESMVETMMQQLLSKEILQEPMKEIGDRYPKWLEENESKIGKEEYERYVRQYNLIRSLNDVYESDPSNFNVIVDLMQQMQECGQPPSDIVKEIAPDVDLAALGQLSPEMVGNQPNCCVM